MLACQKKKTNFSSGVNLEFTYQSKMSNLSRLINSWFITSPSFSSYHGLNLKIYLVVVVVLVELLTYAAAQSNNNEITPGSSAYRFNADFNPSMAIIIIVLICAFFFMGFFAVYIRQCAGERQANGSVRPAGTGRSRRGQRGLDPYVIKTFPIFIYSDVKGLKIGKGALECAVCLNEFEDDEELRLLPKCDHVFHPECIDAWLVSHITCPVCRANLKPISSGEAAAEGVATADGGGSATEMSDSDEETSENPELENTNQVSIRVTENNPQPETINPSEIPISNRPARSKSTRIKITGKFPRSHSTGHSLIQPGENCERFTLRLPDDVRKQIVNGKLNRTTSCLAFPTGDESVSGGSNRGGGYRSGGEGSSRGKNYKFGGGLDRGTVGATKSDRWVFSMAPPFFTRSGSVRSPKLIDGSKTSVKTPFDCLGVKPEGCSEPSPPPQSSARPPV